MSTEKTPHYRIHGVNINKAALSKVKTMEDLKKTEIFSGLPEADQVSGYSQLFADLKPAAAGPAPKAAEAAKA